MLPRDSRFFSQQLSVCESRCQHPLLLTHSLTHSLSLLADPRLKQWQRCGDDGEVKRGRSSCIGGRDRGKGNEEEKWDEAKEQGKREEGRICNAANPICQQNYREREREMRCDCLCRNSWYSLRSLACCQAAAAAEREDVLSRGEEEREGGKWIERNGGKKMLSTKENSRSPRDASFPSQIECRSCDQREHLASCCRPSPAVKR